MQDDVHAIACLSTRHRIGDVSLDKPMPAPRFRCDGRLYLFQVALVSRGEVVEAGNALPELQQPLHEVRADEARTAGDEPPQRRRAQPLFDVLDRSHRKSAK